MVLSFSKELLLSATVDVVLSTAAESEETSAEQITATRINPYTYTFSAPPGQQSYNSDLFLFQCVISFYCQHQLPN